VPAAYVRMERLPLTPNGKLDRKALPQPEADAYGAREYEAPVGAVEEKIASIWAEVLKVQRVGRHDNFFELGGHSLLIQRAVNLLAQKNIKILLADLFECPTPKLLADRIASSAGRTSSDRPICIRKGGLEPPLFLAHEGLGGFAYAQALVQYLDTDIPVYALSPQAADEPPLRTVGALATRMVRMLRTVQPKGPFRVAGWSFGGLLAYEIARQLMDAGEEVEFVGLIDTNHPSRNQSSKIFGDTFEDKKMLLLAIESFAVALSEPAAENHKLALIEMTSQSAAMEFPDLLKAAQDMSLLPSDWMDFTSTQVRQILARSHLFNLAYLSYSARCIAIPVYLFLAKENRETAPFRGWSECLPEDQIRAVYTGGTHFSMMQPPHVKLLGRTISTAIRNSSKEMNGRESLV
jgi:thioesterase domain-containing protein